MIQTRLLETAPCMGVAVMHASKERRMLSEAGVWGLFACHNKMAHTLRNISQVFIQICRQLLPFTILHWASCLPAVHYQSTSLPPPRKERRWRCALAVIVTGLIIWWGFSFSAAIWAAETAPTQYTLEHVWHRTMWSGQLLWARYRLERSALSKMWKVLWTVIVWWYPTYRWYMPQEMFLSKPSWRLPRYSKHHFLWTTQHLRRM